MALARASCRQGHRWPVRAGASAVFLALVGLLLVGPVGRVGPVGAATSSSPAQLYYTVNSPPSLKAVPYSLAGDQLRIGTPRIIATLPGADGVAALSNGDFLIGGQQTGKVFTVHPQNGKLTAMPSGISTAYHVTVSTDGSQAWTAGLPGQLASVPLKPFGAGTRLNLHGDDSSVTMIGFTPTGTFYTSSSTAGSGSFGTIDLTTGTTKRYLSDQRGTHGFTYDPFSRDILLFGSFSVLQIDPAHPGSIVSERILPNEVLDQGLADGQGHLLVASNKGSLYFVDYSASGRVGDTKAVVNRVFLDTNLDDVTLAYTAPTVTPPPAAPVQPVAAASSKPPWVLFIVIALIVIALVGYLIVRSRQSPG